MGRSQMEVDDQAHSAAGNDKEVRAGVVRNVPDVLEYVVEVLSC